MFSPINLIGENNNTHKKGLLACQLRPETQCSGGYLF